MGSFDQITTHLMPGKTMDPVPKTMAESIMRALRGPMLLSNFSMTNGKMVPPTYVQPTKRSTI